MEQPTPSALEPDEIGDETLAPVKWMVPHWPEIKFWFLTGFFSGVGIMLLMGAAALAWVDKAAIATALGGLVIVAFGVAYVCVYFGRHVRQQRLEEHGRKQQKALRIAEEHGRDEMADEFRERRKTLETHIAQTEKERDDWRKDSERWQRESATAKASLIQAQAQSEQARTALEAKVKDYNLALTGAEAECGGLRKKIARAEESNKHLSGVIAALKREQELRAAEDTKRKDADREWSANPFQFIDIAPTNCAVNVGMRAVTVWIRIVNKYSKPRQVWIMADVAIYRREGKTPLSTVPLPVISATVAQNSSVVAAPAWQGVMTPEEAREVGSVHRIDGTIKVCLIRPRVTTLVNLTEDARAETREYGASTPVEVEFVYNE